MYRIARFESIDSTNEYLKQHGEFDVAIADTQTAGRGRMGRRFSSEAGGLYFSFRTGAEFSQIATVAAAVAVCLTLEEVYEVKTTVKWVNDILIDGKKVCGILAESRLPEYIVIGIGINLQNDISDELLQIAGKVSDYSDKTCPREDLALKIIDRFYSEVSDAEIIKKYRARIDYFGKQIAVFENGNSRIATAIDIDDKGRLVVREENGEISTLSSAEISTKKQV